MRSLLTGRAARYLSDAARAFERAPAEVAVALCIAAAFSYAIEIGDHAMPRWFEVAITALLMGAVAWTGTLLHALGAWSLRTRHIVTLLGAVLAGLYGGFVLDFDRSAEGWRAAMLVAAAALWLVAVPVIAARRRTARAAGGGAGDATVAADGVGAADATSLMRVVTGRVLLRVIGALLYCAALFAGLALALGAINTLFELDMKGTIYGHVFAWIFFVLAPWIVIGGLDEYVRPAPPRPEVASVVHRMTAFLVPPLVVLYFAILYAYTVRIAVTGEVPKNIVSPLVLAAGALALLALLLFDPPARGTAGARVLRAAPPLFVPLSVLGAWAILLRVEQYGWTEFRLLRLLLLGAFGVLAALASVQVLRRQRLTLYGAPLALAGLLVLAAIGPWSVLSVSRASQQARLDAALQAAGVDPDVARPAALVPVGMRPRPERLVHLAGPPPRSLPSTARLVAVPADSVPALAADVYDRINATARYLAGHFGPRALPPALAAIGAVEDYRFDMAAALGFRRIHPELPEQRFLSTHVAGTAEVRLGDVSAFRVQAGRGMAPAGNATLVDGTTSLRIRAGEEVFTAELGPLLNAADAEMGGRHEVSPSHASLPVMDANGAERGTLLVLELQAERTEAGAIVLRMLSGILLVRSGGG
jgi:hypothetical protein